MKRRADRSPEAIRLAQRITTFVNVAFGRKLGRLGPSRNLVDAVQESFDNGYTDIEIKMAFWAARCIPNTWIGEQLAKSIQPEIVLRHKGGMNTITGKPAVRWLDDLIERVGEINPRLAGAILKRLPQEHQDDREMLLSVGVELET